MKPKILISEYSYTAFPALSQSEWDQFHQRAEIVINQTGEKLPQNILVQMAQDVDGVVAGLELFRKEEFVKLPQLKCISRAGSGTDSIDHQAAREHQVAILNCPEATVAAVSELAISLSVALLRHIQQHSQDLHQGKWHQRLGNTLNTKTVGIIGAGNIGKRTVQIMKFMGAKVLINDLDPDEAWFKQEGLTNSPKNDLYAQSDILILHPSYLPTNKHLINQEAFDQMKPGMLFINLSRGPMVDEKALVKALSEGIVAGAALDVYEQEPYLGPLAKLNNVILTPHIGANTQESRHLMQYLALEKILDFFDTRP